MGEELSRKEIMSSKTGIEDLIWYPPGIEKTVQNYLKQKKQLISDINELGNKINIKTETKDKMYIPEENLKIDKDTNTIYIIGQIEPTESISYPFEMTISSPWTDFTISFKGHNYTIKQRKIAEEFTAEITMIDMDIQKILNKYNYKQLNEYKTEKGKVYT